MKVYVDGRGLLEAFRGRGADVIVEGDRTKSRLNLVRWLARYAESHDCEVELVFEAELGGGVLPPVEHHGRVRVVNLDPGEEALHEIAGPANRAARKERVFVVTADPRLISALERGRARAFEPERFLSRARTLMRGEEDDEEFEEPDEKFSGLSDEEVGFWLKFFRRGGR